MHELRCGAELAGSLSRHFSNLSKAGRPGRPKAFSGISAANKKPAQKAGNEPRPFLANSLTWLQAGRPNHHGTHFPYACCARSSMPR
ncbi:hypothetical protein OHAE_373 [Ochrobactrum soli]|uniref:Uncharacterized protein n=1 Tax=Ochrobactrum soli TaxID=2448455 RepID=A0A2P9HK63_9HYPH|nr:hypothetical protein OHAE_373 [[Ochrobactrum] soli]